MHFRPIVSSLFIAVLLSTSVAAQTSPEYNASRIELEMQKLNTVGSVLYMAAHPDDENTRLISYLVNEKHYRTGYLALTRGDGGQNLLGKEQGAALGVLRTQELLAARRNDGAKQFFTRANDFGYVKSPQATFKIWNKDSILSDVVLTIRRFKPDVIVLRFPTTGEGGHGHHTASAILGVEAFDAAADPNRFAWQLKLPGVSVWKTRRLFWNTFKFGSVNTTSPKQLQIDVGGYNPLLGESYGEIAADSRSMHKSQGFGVKKQRGKQIEYFKLLKGDKVDHADSSLMTGINTTWSRLPNTAIIQKEMTQLLGKYNPLHPENSLKTLTDIYQSIQQLSDKSPYVSYWKELKIKQLKRIIATCSGMWMEATANDYSVVPGDKIKVDAKIISRNISGVKISGIDFNANTMDSKTQILPLDEMYSVQKMMTIPASTDYSDPYWLKKPHTNAMYEVDDPKLIGQPQNKSKENVYFHLAINGVKIVFKRPLVYKYVDPIRGEVYRPFEVLPPVTINLSNGVFVFNDTLPKEVVFSVEANRANVDGKLNVDVPEGWSIKIDHPMLHIAKKYEVIEVKALLTPAQDGKDGKLEASVSIQGKKYHKSITRIEYNHIPYQFLLKNAEAKIVHLDLKKKGGDKIGYIPGAGDKIPAALGQIGYQVTTLTNDLLKNEDLSQYAAIVTGVRAYNINIQLTNFYDKLMNYIKDGGNLIVQYNTNSRLGPIQQKIGPYPFKISKKRVTDETAQVNFINPKSPIVNTPNKITSADFKGWIQERGTYFATHLDKHYQTVFSMHDAGEKPLKGSLIYSKYGKGYFVYSGLVFFRELPAGVPGAYRLFENLLSLGK